MRMNLAAIATANATVSSAIAAETDCATCVTHQRCGRSPVIPFGWDRPLAVPPLERRREAREDLVVYRAGGTCRVLDVDLGDVAADRTCPQIGHVDHAGVHADASDDGRRAARQAKGKPSSAGSASEPVGI